MIRTITEMGDPVLYQVAREVSPEEIPSPEIQGVIDDLIQTLKSTTGVGLAAPQISQSLRICIVDKPLTVLINPIITPVGEVTDTSFEGCLSVPGVRGEVRRPQTVRVQALDRRGKEIDQTWTLFRAIVVQHEVDHLDGILYVSRTEFTFPDNSARVKSHESVPVRTHMIGGSKKTFVVDSPKPVGGAQHVTFGFDQRGTVTGIRVQPGGARITGVSLSGVRFKRKDYPAGLADQVICGERGLIVAAGDQLRIDMAMPKGKRQISVEADFDPAT